MSYSLEDILTYLDGEMPTADIVRFEAALAQDSDLAARTEAQRRMANTVRSHYTPIANEGVPERFASLLGEGAASTGDGSVMERIKSWLTGPQAVLGASALASLALGMIVGSQFLAPNDGISGTSTRANAQLAAALDASNGNDAWLVPVTFRDGSGQFCRAFRAASAATSGLACRTQGSWQVQVLVVEPGEAETGYRLASSALPQTVLLGVDARIEGDPLDADAVAAAVRAGWVE